MTADNFYRQAREIAKEIAAQQPEPLFYRDHGESRIRSERSFAGNRAVGACLAFLREEAPSYGHGLSHAEKVAIDAGTIVIVEAAGTHSDHEVDRLVTLAHLAGLLHDIERSRSDHAARGAERAATILGNMKLSVQDISVVACAIRNHEAFQPCEALESSDARLLSDALYDADKFRWGPDNFTEMLWDMLSLRPVPLSRLLERFLPGMKGLEKIRHTFRSETGKTYGPDFIDRGISIGRELYRELAALEREPSREDHAHYTEG